MFWINSFFNIEKWCRKGFFKIKILNSLGQTIFNDSDSLIKNNGISYDFSSLKKGIYHLKFETKDEIFMQSIILQ